MNNLNLTDTQKAKVNTAVMLLNQVISEIDARPKGEGAPFKGPAHDQYFTLLDGTSLIELVQLGNCTTRTTKKAA